MQDFKIRKSIRSTDDGVNDYIESLEQFILNLSASNTNRLIFKLDELNGVIADDVQKIIDGDVYTEEEKYSTELETYIKITTSNLKVLSDDKNSKVFDRTMMLYGKLKDFKETSNVVKSMIPEVEEKKEETKEVEIDRNSNVFEQLQEKHYNKKKG